MAEIDPVILQLRADVNKYMTDLRNTTTSVDRLLGTQEKRVIALENQFKQSSNAISGHLRSMAAALAAGLSVQQIMAYSDAWTRFQNSLKVAGLEGDKLTAVQERLFAIANKYQTNLESVGGLYGKAAQNANVLGASQSQLIALTEAASASLKISGATAEGASGALLGLSQALGSGRVQTEDFNQMLEGGLLPILQEVAKRIDGTGGTVAGLKNKLQDMKGAGISSTQLFTAITQSLEALQSKAARASGTISGAFTTLGNAMTKYVGEAGQANGASAALAAGIITLADNLGTVTNALAIIAGAILTKYTAGMVTAGVATIAKAAADVRASQTAAALAIAEAELAGMMGVEAAAATRAAAAVTALSVAQGVAARAGAGLLAVVGGPVGAALLAVGAAIAYVAVKADEVIPPTQAYQVALDASSEASKRAADAADKLATAHGKARSDALEAARAERRNTEEKLAGAKASLALAQAELQRAKAYVAAMDAGAMAGAETFNPVLTDGESKAQSNVNAAQKAVSNYQGALDAITKALNTPEAKVTTAAGKTKKQTGPTPAEIEAKHQEEMARLRQEQLRAELSITTDAGQRASISRDLLDEEYKERRTQIEADKHFTKAQKAAQIKALNKLYGVHGLDKNGEIVVDGTGGAYGKQVTRDENAQISRETADAARATYDAQRDALQNQQDLADSTAERRRIALEMLKLDYEYQRAQQAAIAGDKKGLYSDAEKATAEAKIAALDAQYPNQQERARRSNESPLQSYARSLNKSDGALADQAEGYVVSELENVRDGIKSAITKAIGTDDPIITGLLNMLIEQVLLKPIANALNDASSGGSSGIGGLLSSAVTSVGSIFGRASGGKVAAGQVYRINEGAAHGRGEYFRPDVAGQIIPLGRTNAVGHGGAGNRVFQISVDARNSVTPEGFAEQLSQEILTQAATMDAHAAKAVMKQVPGRVTQYQRDGN